MALFCSLIEIAPEVGSELDPDNVAGAAVRCYIPAKTFMEAWQRLQSSLNEKHLRLVDIEWFVNDDAMDWERPDDTAANSLIDDAIRYGAVEFGTFHMWGHDAPDA